METLTKETVSHTYRLGGKYRLIFLKYHIDTVYVNPEYIVLFLFIAISVDQRPLTPTCNRAKCPHPAL